jgi:hypothetical protein
MEYVMAGDFDFLVEEVRGRLMSWLMVATDLERLVRLETKECWYKYKQKSGAFP